MQISAGAYDGYLDRRSLVKLILKKVENKELSAAEKVELEFWERIWNAYEVQREYQEALLSIYFLYSHPDEKTINLDGNQSIFFSPFEDPMSLKELTRKLLGFVKNKVMGDKTLKTIIKGVIDHAEEEKPSDSTFEVELQNSQYRQIGFKRKRISSLKHGALAQNTPGAIIGWTNNKGGNSKTNIYQTIKAAIVEGSFTHEPLHIQISDRHFRYPVYQHKQNFNIMLVLDISNSVKWILKFMDKVIAALTAQTTSSKDKLGLIIFNEDHAQIMHYPTINMKHVIGTINTLSPKGKTPLADGVKLALQTLEHSRFQVTGMANAIVLLSDCFPEPITGEYEDQMDEPVCQELLHVCDKIAESMIKLLVLTPSVSVIKNHEKHLGYRLGQQAAERAKGRFLNLEAKMYASPFSQNTDYAFSDQMMKNFINEVSAFRMSE